MYGLLLFEGLGLSGEESMGDLEAEENRSKTKLAAAVSQEVDAAYVSV